MVIALNMIDLAERDGLVLSPEGLARELGVPVIPTVAVRRRGLAELRVKESDRIAAVVAGLRAIGVEAEANPDGFRVAGGGARGGHVVTEGDHRIAMAFSIAGIRVPVVVSETDSIRTSYPDFLATLARLNPG